MREGLEEFTLHLPFLYDERERILASAEWYFARLPYSVYSLGRPACLGPMLKAIEQGEPFHTSAEEGSAEEFLSFFSGNPATGSTVTLKAVVHADGTVEVRPSRHHGFISTVKRLAEGYRAAPFPYQPPTLTVHDVIESLRSYTVTPQS